MEITIPTMEWQQIGGDMDPGASGGTIAAADGHAVELIQIQPVREYVGDKEAAEVGFPFWTRVAYFDANDLSVESRDVKSALDSIGMDLETLEADYTPEQRALVIAEALLGYGRADEGPSGWSKDLDLPEKVKWWGDKVAGAEYISDEDEAFRNDVLGHDEIRTAIEEVVERMADESSATGWSTIGDQVRYDLESEGFDPETAVGIAEFGDAVAVNGDLETEKTMAGVEGELEAEGYEDTDKGGRIPSDDGYASAEHVISAVAQELGRSEEEVEEAAKGLDWWQEEIPWGTSGYSSVWAKRKSGGAKLGGRNRETTVRR